MRYTIISLNDERKAYKDAIRNTIFSSPEWHLDAFDAYREDPIKGIENRGMVLNQSNWPNPKIGELGVWLSNFDRWLWASEMREPLIVFEDDAIVHYDFDEKIADLYNDLPEDWDFMALWVPENQRQDYYYDVTFNHNGHPRIEGVLPNGGSYFSVTGKLALVYQGYGMVSLMYSPRGGQKLVELAQRYGITGPVDCWIYEQAHMGNLKGYAPHPDYTDIVQYDWQALSHVQQSERVM